MRCQDIMRTHVITIHKLATVLEAARKMRDANIGFLPVVNDKSEVVGVITDRDIAIRVVAEGLRPGHIPVLDAMTLGLVACRPEDRIESAENTMRRMGKSRIMVTDGRGKLHGIISMADLAGRGKRRHVAETSRELTSRERRRADGAPG